MSRVWFRYYVHRVICLSACIFRKTLVLVNWLPNFWPAIKLEFRWCKAITLRTLTSPAVIYSVIITTKASPSFRYGNGILYRIPRVKPVGILCTLDRQFPDKCLWTFSTIQTVQTVSRREERKQSKTIDAFVPVWPSSKTRRWPPLENCH